MDGTTSYNLGMPAPEPAPSRAAYTVPPDKFQQRVLQWLNQNGSGTLGPDGTPVIGGVIKVQVYGQRAQTNARAPIVRDPSRLLHVLDWRPSDDYMTNGLDTPQIEEFISNSPLPATMDFGETYFVDAVAPNRGVVIARTKINEGAKRAAAASMDPFDGIKAAFAKRLEKHVLGEFEQAVGLPMPRRNELAPVQAQPAPIRLPGSGFMMHPDDVGRLYEQERADRLAVERKLERAREEQRLADAEDARSQPYREVVAKALCSLVELGEEFARKKINEGPKKSKGDTEESPATKKFFQNAKEDVKRLAQPPRRRTEEPAEYDRPADFRTAAGPPVSMPPPPRHTPPPTRPSHRPPANTIGGADLYESPLLREPGSNQNQPPANDNPFLSEFGTTGSPNADTLFAPPAEVKPSAKLSADLSERLVPVADAMITQLCARAREIGLFRIRKIRETCSSEAPNLFLPECLRVGITHTELLLLAEDPKVMADTLLRAITAEQRRRLGMAMGTIEEIIRDMAHHTDWKTYLNQA